jgi:hypothetical protein
MAADPLECCFPSSRTVTGFNVPQQEVTLEEIRFTCGIPCRSRDRDLRAGVIHAGRKCETRNSRVRHVLSADRCHLRGLRNR